MTLFKRYTTLRCKIVVGQILVVYNGSFFQLSKNAKGHILSSGIVLGVDRSLRTPSSYPCFEMQVWQVGRKCKPAGDEM